MAKKEVKLTPKTQAARLNDWVQKSNGKSEKEEEITKLTVRMSKTLHRAVKLKAVEKGQTLEDFVNAALEAAIDGTTTTLQ